MKVNPQQLLDDGFIILRQVIPPDQLDALRTNFEILLDRQKAIWRRERKPTTRRAGLGKLPPNRGYFSTRSLTKNRGHGGVLPA